MTDVLDKDKTGEMEEVEAAAKTDGGVKVWWKGLTDQTRTTFKVFGLIQLAIILVIALHVGSYRTMSPIDELQHVDHLYKVSQGKFIVGGERVGQDAMREQSCRGIDAGIAVPECKSGAVYDPEQFQERGVNTSAANFPLYYVVTGVVARVGKTVALSSAGIMQWGRLAGVLWLGGGALLLFLALGMLGMGMLERSVWVILVAVTPTVLHASATINPDAASLVSGAAVLFTLLHWERTQSRKALIWLVAVSVIAGLFKASNLLAVMVAVLYCGIRWFQGRSSSAVVASETADTEVLSENKDGSQPRYRQVALALIAAGIVSIGIWVSWSTVSKQILPKPAGPVIKDPMAARFTVDRFDARHTIRQASAFVTPIHAPHVPVKFQAAVWEMMTVWFFNVLLIGALVGRVLFKVGDSAMQAMSAATLTVMVVGGPLTAIMIYVLGSQQIIIPARYGLALLPFIVAATAGIVTGSRWWVRLCVGFAGVAYLFTVLQLAGVDF